MLTLGCVILLIHSMLYLTYTHARERTRTRTRMAKCISFLSFHYQTWHAKSLSRNYAIESYIRRLYMSGSVQWFIRVNEFSSNNEQFITSTTTQLRHGCGGTAEKSCRFSHTTIAIGSTQRITASIILDGQFENMSHCPAPKSPEPYKWSTHFRVFL